MLFLIESACQHEPPHTHTPTHPIPDGGYAPLPWVCIKDFWLIWLQICLLSYVQTEENSVMKEALGRMKNSSEKNMCWQDGRLFDDKEDWVVDSCTKCTCQVVPSPLEKCAHLRCILILRTLTCLLCSFMAGIQDCVPPDHMPSGGLCQPLLYRWRVLPRVFA